MNKIVWLAIGLFLIYLAASGKIEAVWNALTKLPETLPVGAR